MPTWSKTARFLKDFASLTPEERDAFMVAVRKFVEDLKASRPFRPSLRVKGVQGTDGVYEMTWEGNGRATFEYGVEQIEGEPHIVWRRIGGHDIFKSP